MQSARTGSRRAPRAGRASRADHAPSIGWQAVSGGPPAITFVSRPRGESNGLRHELASFTGDRSLGAYRQPRSQRSVTEACQRRARSPADMRGEDIAGAVGPTATFIFPIPQRIVALVIE